MHALIIIKNVTVTLLTKSPCTGEEIYVTLPCVLCWRIFLEVLLGRMFDGSNSLGKGSPEICFNRNKKKQRERLAL